MSVLQIKRVTRDEYLQYIEGLEKKIKRRLLAGQSTPKLIEELTFLISELRKLNFHEKADLLEMTLNQFMMEETAGTETPSASSQIPRAPPGFPQVNLPSARPPPGFPPTALRAANPPRAPPTASPPTDFPPAAPPTAPSAPPPPAANPSPPSSISSNDSDELVKSLTALKELLSKKE